MKGLGEVYVLRGIMYVPHYSRPGKFVSPGYGKFHKVEFSASDLLVKGAKKQKAWLFAPSV